MIRQPRRWPRLLAAGILALSLIPPPPAAGRPADSPPPRLRIATWNLAWLNRRSHEGKIPRSDADYARLARYARQIDADIVALQEVDGEQAARRVFDPAVYAFHFTADAETPQRAGFAYRKGLEVRAYPDAVGLAVEGTGTHRGADIGVSLGSRRLRLLSIHLKTGCWSDSPAAGTDACEILAKQVPPLEAWIDARAREGVPFAVLGDFNRRFDPGDPIWADLDDGNPPEARLADVMAGHESRCWNGEHPSFVDHIVLGRRASGWLVRGSFQQLLFDPADLSHRQVLSDHCPVWIVLEPGAAAAEAPPPPSRRLAAEEAAGHVGEAATVCGRVASARYLPGSRRQPTFLDLDRPYPARLFTVVIWGADRAAFNSPEITLQGKRICVTGRLESYQGRAEIIARTPSQIVVETGE